LMHHTSLIQTTMVLTQTHEIRLHGTWKAFRWEVHKSRILLRVDVCCIQVLKIGSSGVITSFSEVRSELCPLTSPQKPQGHVQKTNIAGKNKYGVVMRFVLCSWFISGRCSNCIGCTASSVMVTVFILVSLFSGI